MLNRSGSGRQDELRIDRLPPGPVHAVGAASLEVASMARFLVEQGRDDIVLHDLAPDFRAAFEQAHKLQSPQLQARSWAALSQCTGGLRTGPDYLTGVEHAAAVLIPVAWFLHRVNHPLQRVQHLFVTWPDACFRLWSGPVIGITGTVGKTTTTAFTAVLTGGIAGGNDREWQTDLDVLANQSADRVLAFELSNRHLHNGWRRTLDVGVLTSIALNHEVDHGDFATYRQTKYAMASACERFLYPVGLPRQWPDAAAACSRGQSFGRHGDWWLDGDTLAGVGGLACELPGIAASPALTRQNVIAAAAGALIVGVPPRDVTSRAAGLGHSVPQHRHTRQQVGERWVVNDAAACVPAATAALVRSLAEPSVLVCGGDRQLYRPGEFAELAEATAGNPAVVQVITMGPMAPHLHEEFAAAGVTRVQQTPDLASAVGAAANGCIAHDATLVFSPGCGTGTMHVDKYARGEEFDLVVGRLFGA